MSVIMKPMKRRGMKTNDALIAEQLRTDSDFRAGWERTALARAVAMAIVRYRAERGLSQRELAQRVGMKQPQVARLERGEVNPSIETLVRISVKLGIGLTIDIRPGDVPILNVSMNALAQDVVGQFRADETKLPVAVP
jgi:transcriptional regulator with XRE-family HTH domain